jgi:hypothetical protein
VTNIEFIESRCGLAKFLAFIGSINSWEYEEGCFMDFVDPELMRCPDGHYIRILIENENSTRCSSLVRYSDCINCVSSWLYREMTESDKVFMDKLEKRMVDRYSYG